MEVTFADIAGRVKLPRVAVSRDYAAQIFFLGLLGAYVALVPNLTLLPETALYDSKRLLQLGVMVGLGIGLAAFSQLRAELTQTCREMPVRARAGLALILALGSVSALAAPVSRYAFLEVGHYTLLFVVAAFVAASCRRMPVYFDRAVVAFLSLSLALYTVVFAAGYVAHGLDAAVPLWPEGHLGFDNIRFFNQYQTWMLPFVVVAPALIGGRSRLLRSGLYGIAVVWWMLLFASGGRGTSIGLGVGAIAVLVFYGRTSWSWARRQIAVAAGGGVLFLLIFKAWGSAARASVLERDFVHGGRRLQAWGDAVDMVIQAPLLGVGPMHHAFLPNGAMWGHPHNAVLQWGAEWGLPATLVALGLAAWGGWTWISQCREAAETSTDTERQVRVAITAALVAGGIHALVSGVVVMPMSQLLMAVIIGWAWGKYLREAVQEEAPARPGWLLRPVLAASLAAVLWGTAADVPQLEAQRNEFISAQEVQTIHPRYWQQGFFGY